MSLKAPIKQSNISPESLPEVRLKMVDIGGRVAQVLGLPRSVGEIYGLLYLSTKPASAPEIATALSISKGSVSTGVRQLLALGFIRKVWVQEQRKDYYEAVLDLGNVARASYDSIIKVRTNNAERRFRAVEESLAESKSEMIPEDYALIKERVERLGKMRKRIKLILPIIERLIK